MDLHPGDNGADPIGVPPMSDIEDFESVFESVCSRVSPSKTVIFQGTHRIQKSDSLFYATANAAGVSLKVMTDSGSTGCTLSEPAVERLLQHIPNMRRYSADDDVIIGCGGHQVTPSAAYDVEIVVYDCKMVIPMFLVSGQTDNMILGIKQSDTVEVCVNQVVVPTDYRAKILTYHRVLCNFFWPGLKIDVTKYCRTCHIYMW